MISKERGASSLARAAGARTSLVISAIIVLAHGMFLWGQLGPEMMSINFSADVMYETRGTLASAVGLLEHSVCKSDQCLVEGHPPVNVSNGAAELICDALSCTYCKRSLGVTTGQRCEFELTEDVKNFGYLWAVTEMWTQDKNLKGPCRSNHLNQSYVEDGGCTGIYPGRPAAVILFGFSFLWPHVKLLALHLCLYLPLRPGFRRNTSFWLSFFGKWTLTDVLVCCALLGLLDIFDARSVMDLWHSLDAEAPTICSTLCANLTNSSASASECVDACHAVATALDGVRAGVGKHDGLPASEVWVSVSLHGLASMFAFCAGVLLSISTSVGVEALDDRVRLREAGRAPRAAHGTRGRGAAARSRGASAEPLDAALLGSPVERAAAPPASPPPPAPEGSGGAARLAEAGLGGGDAGGGPRAAAAGEEERPMARAGRARWAHAALVVAQLASTVIAFSSKLFARHVRGSLPLFLGSIGYNFDGTYTILELGYLAARWQDWSVAYVNVSMVAAYWGFLVVCPLFRGLSLLALLLLPLRRASAVRLYRLSRYASYYYAYEVMLLAVPIIATTVKPMTSGLTGGVHPWGVCLALNSLYPDPPGMRPDADPGDKCFGVTVQPLFGYWACVANVLFFLASGFDGSPTHRYVHRRLFPEDRSPPPSLVECCACRR